jgi:hypothetical protein
MAFSKTEEQISADSGIPIGHIRTAVFGAGYQFGIAYVNGARRTAWKLRHDAGEQDYLEVIDRLKNYHNQNHLNG